MEALRYVILCLENAVWVADLEAMQALRYVRQYLENDVWVGLVSGSEDDASIALCETVS